MSSNILFYTAPHQLSMTPKLHQSLTEALSNLTVDDDDLRQLEMRLNHLLAGTLPLLQGIED